MAVHLTSYGAVLFGGRRFGVPDPVGALRLALEALLIGIPLSFHAIYGVWLSLGPVQAPDPGSRRAVILMRITGALSLLFVAAHAIWLRLPLLQGELNPEDVPEMLAAQLSSTLHGVPLAAALHLLGLGVVLFHLAVGLPRFIERWQLAGARITRSATAIGCVALFAVGAATVIEFATGSVIPRFFGVGR